MINRKSMFAGLLLLAGLTCQAQQAAPDTVPVHMVVTVEPLKESENTVQALSREDVQVKQGRNNLTVTDWIPGRGEQAALQLFIVIDETSDTSLGSQLDDLRGFIEAQPKTTWIGLGYMRNAGVTIVQNFTTDHALAAKALRLPLGSTSSSDSPYLSLISLLKGWPENKMRREVLMVTDGIDRLRGTNGGRPDIGLGMDRTAPGAPAMPGAPGMGRQMPVIPYISPDVDSASREAQRNGVIVHSIYTRGVGHVGRNYYELTNGQNGISKVADETGGESFFLGVQDPVSFKPYLDRLQIILDNQYFLAFLAKPGKKADLQRVRISTEVPKVEIVSADNVWVPALPQPPKK